MKSLLKFDSWKSINEKLSVDQIKTVEEYADKLFKEVGMDVEFSKHFKDRLNDERNQKPISTAELIGFFKRAYEKSGKKISQLPVKAEAVIQDMRTDLNTPFVIEYDPKNKEVDLKMKTIMRKKEFQTTNPKIKI